MTTKYSNIERITTYIGNSAIPPSDMRMHSHPSKYMDLIPTLKRNFLFRHLEKWTNIRWKHLKIIVVIVDMAKSGPLKMEEMRVRVKKTRFIGTHTHTYDI